MENENEGRGRGDAIDEAAKRAIGAAGDVEVDQEGELLSKTNGKHEPKLRPVSAGLSDGADIDPADINESESRRPTRVLRE